MADIFDKVQPDIFDKVSGDIFDRVSTGGTAPGQPTQEEELAALDSSMGAPAAKVAPLARPRETTIQPAPETSWWDDIKSWFYTPNADKAKASNIMGLSEATGKAPTEVLRNYEPMTREIAAPTYPTAKRTAEVAMTAGIGAGLAANPIATATALGTFFGLDELKNLTVSKLKDQPYEFQGGKGISDLLDAEGFSRDAIDLAEFIGEGIVAGGVTKAGRSVFSSIVQGIRDKAQKIRFINDVAKEVKDKGISPDEAAQEMGGGEAGPKEPPKGGGAGDIFDKVEIDQRAHEAATSPLNDLPEPTQAQKEAGNYKLGHVELQGMDISIENPKGSIRSGTSPEGKAWETEMQDHYGYIKKAEGKDGDKLDVFIGENPASDRTFVVNQINPATGKFDEHKIMLGYNNAEMAREAYLRNYEKGWQGLGSMVEMPMDKFKEWVKEGDTTKPVKAGTRVYRGGDTALDVSRGAQEGISVATDRAVAERFGDVVNEAELPADTKILKDADIPPDLRDVYMSDAQKLANFPVHGSDRVFLKLQETVLQKQRAIVDYARAKGFDAVEFPFEEEIRVIKPNVLKEVRGAESVRGNKEVLQGKGDVGGPGAGARRENIQFNEEQGGKGNVRTAPPQPQRQEITLDTTWKEFVEGRTGKPLSQIGEKSKTFQTLQQEFNEAKRKLLDEEEAQSRQTVREKMQDEAAAPPRPRREKVTKVEDKSLLKYIKEYGGLSSEKVKELRGPSSTKEDFGRSLMSAFQDTKGKKGRMGLDEMYDELVEKGIIEQAPEGMHGDDWIIHLLKQERKGIGVTIERLQKVGHDDRISADERAFIEQLRKEGHSERDIAETLGRSKEEIQSEVSRKTPQERLKEAEDLDDVFVKEEPNGSDLFKTSDKYTLSGDQEAKFSEMKHTDTGRKGERMFETPKATADELYERQKGKKAPSGTADVGGYAEGKAGIVEMPEIVELAKGLCEGKYPRVMKRLQIKNALGLFRSGGRKAGSIELLADIFKDPVEAAKVVSHEIGHMVDWLPDKDLGRGNILGRIASLKKYTEKLLEEKPGAGGMLTEADRARLRAEVKKQIEQKIKDSEIVRLVMKEVPKYEEVGVTREMITEIMTGEHGRDKYPDLYKFLASQPASVKKEIVVKALKDVIDERLSQFKQKKQVGTEFKVVEEVGEKYKPTQADIEARFRQLLDEEIQKRKLFTWETITKELKDLTQKWKPFDEKANRKFTRYRYSSKELYADAFSVLLNDPKLLHDTAPSFEKAFFNYLERKPELKALYGEIQDRLGNPKEILETREQNIREMFAKDREERLKEEKQPLELKKGLFRALIDRNMEWFKRRQAAAKQGKRIDPEKDPAYWTEELPYVAGKLLEHYRQVDSNIVQPLIKKGVTVDDLGEHMMLKRIAGERANMANPLGHTPQTALKQLEVLKSKLGDEKYGKVEKAVEDYWKLRERIFDDLEASGMLSEKLIAHIKNNRDYATFNVMAEFEKQYGRGVTSHIYKQIGTLNEIRNPFVATLMKDAALIRAAEVTKAKRDMIQFLRETDPKAVTAAETRWNGKYHEPIDAKDPSQGMVIYLQQGKPEAFYIPRDMAETFFQRPFEGKALVKGIQAVTMPLKAVLVSKNPIWMLRNIIRDFYGTATQIPGLSASKLSLYYARALKDAYKDAIKGESTETVNEMLRKKMLVVDRQWSSMDVPGETAVDLKLQKIGENPVRTRNLFVRPLVRISDALERAGKFTERLGKIAGYKYLETRADIPERTRAHLVRTRVGTPDPYRAGYASPIYNNIFLFSNIAKEGFRASKEAFTEKPADYTWKTFKYNIAPKLVMLGLATGLGGPTAKKVMDGVSEYDKTNYLIVPLWLDKKGKSVYLRFPQAYTGQVIGGLFWKLINGKIAGRESMTAFGLGSTPYGVNPYLTVSSDLIQYYGLGLNPYDSYKGRTVLSDQEYKAGGKRANVAMGKHIFSELGGSTVYRFGPDDLDKQKTGLERFLKVPPGTIAGTFLKVSNQGEREQYREALQPVGQKIAQNQLTVRERITETVNEGKTSIRDIQALRKQLQDEGLLDKTVSVGQFRQRFNRVASRKEDNPKVDAVASAPTNEEKVTLLSEYRKSMAASEYNSLVETLRRERLVSGNVLARARKTANNP
jgi:hypothetical protein